MAVLPEDFLLLSECSESDHEIRKREIISRSYYAAYHAAELLRHLLNMPLPDVAKAGMHKKLCLAYQQAKDLQLQVIGNQLNRQRLKRHRADYELSQTVGYEEAHREAQKNIRLFNLIKQMLET
jgi:uncharacterized protein (UPF0332 family)